MIQFLNNIWIALSSENLELVNWLLVPASIIENYLFMTLFLTVFNVKTHIKNKLIYVLGMTIVAFLSPIIIPSPYYVFINYICGFLLIKLTFNMNFLKSIISLVTPIFCLALFNTLFQSIYLIYFNINFDQFMATPIYRMSYLTFIYMLLFIMCFILKKYKNIKLNLELLDTLDRKTLILLCINILMGFFTLCIQLVTTAFCIDIVPIIISVLNFILLVSFLILSIYSFTRVIKLANTRRELASAEEYNRSLQNLYDEVKGFNHDFNNIVSTIDGYIENNDMSGLKQYFYGVKKDCKLTNSLSLLNPSTINNPGIYSLLNNKYFKAINLGINFEIDFFLDLDSVAINMYKFSRILGILIDNAIEEAQKCDKKIIKVSFIRENRNNRALITIKNTYLNKDVNIEKIFNKGISGKLNHSGIGLWEVRKYVKNSKNLDLFTNKTDEFFIQELSIYDI